MVDPVNQPLLGILIRRIFLAICVFFCVKIDWHTHVKIDWHTHINMSNNADGEHIMPYRDCNSQFEPFGDKNDKIMTV